MSEVNKVLKVFMGQEVESTHKPDEERTEHKVSKSNFHKIQESLGVTQEVRQVIHDAEETVMKEGFKFLKDEVKATKSDQRLILGTGNDRVTLTMKGESTVTIPAPPGSGGEVSQRTVYGAASIDIKKSIPNSLKSEELSTWQTEIEDSFKKPSKKK